MARPYIYLSPVRGDRTNCVYICHPWLFADTNSL
jgi:hypothetical protein